MTDANAILARFQQADSIRSSVAGIWRDVGAYVDPLRRDIVCDETLSGILDISGGANIFDSTARQANMVYAAGVMSWMTPAESPWAAFDAPRYLGQDETVKSWYSRCTDITFQILAESNFYLTIHNAYLDDGGFGTSGLFIEEDSEKGVRFDLLPIGRYSILEDCYRIVDTLFSQWQFSPRQAAKKFGEKALPMDVRKCLGDEKKQDLPDEYIRAVYPREDRDLDKTNAANMEWASVWIHKKTKAIVLESGYREKPFAVHRHAIKGLSPYGVSPGMEALFDARQLNLMEQYLDTLVEKQVTPPVIVPAAYDGVVDLRGGGVTEMAPDGTAPQLWGNPGNYLVGQDRTSFRRKQIQDAFHVDLFQTLAAVPVGKEMTAQEVMQRQRDRLQLFSPTFARKNQELISPIMRRVFAILLRAGAFPPVPRSLAQIGPDGMAFIPDPEIVYTSRLALQMRALHNDAYERTLGKVAPLVQMAPDVLDHFDTDAITRGISRNEGFPEDWLRAQQDVAAIRQQRAEAQAAAEEEASQLEEAGAVAKLAGAGVV